MIRNLKIRNYALIENLEISFDSGYITITGETGAGKSILMGALSLILGQRADSSVLFAREEKCIVEGQFEINPRFEPFFEENDLDFDTITILRREILPGGKSRAFINDSPVNLALLKELGDNLVDIHSQHQNLRLNDHHFQMDVLDNVGNNRELLSKYGKLFKGYRDKKAEIKQLQEELERISGELDFLSFQFGELDAAKLKEGELQELEEELDQLDNAEEIRMALAGTVNLLDADGMILNLLSDAISMQRKVAGVFKPSAEFEKRLESAFIELKDVTSEMQSIAEKTESDPDRQQEVRERLDLLYNLLQKNRVRDISDLMELHQQLNEKIAAITFSDQNLGKLNRELDAVYGELMEAANSLHKKRIETAKSIRERISSQLVQLGIPNASFDVRIDKTEQPGPSGTDDVTFLFSANRQAPPEEISRVASGGEISRLMLSIKSLLSDFKGQPTLIFDEIDAGVSGEIAERMGSIMKQMSGKRQVIAITHLPQVAAQGKDHFLVYKQDDGLATNTHIRRLTDEERVTEIAKLLSGERLTEAALSNAKELLGITS